jgi:chromosome segregation ATPase
LEDLEICRPGLADEQASIEEYTRAISNIETEISAKRELCIRADIEISTLQHLLSSACGSGLSRFSFSEHEIADFETEIREIEEVKEEVTVLIKSLCRKKERVKNQLHIATVYAMWYEEAIRRREAQIGPLA